MRVAGEERTTPLTPVTSVTTPTSPVNLVPTGRPTLSLQLKLSKANVQTGQRAPQAMGAPAGASVLRRLAVKLAKPGVYRIVLTARTASGTTATASATFTVKPER
jgi:hypothetical protein